MTDFSQEVWTVKSKEMSEWDLEINIAEVLGSIHKRAHPPNPSPETWDTGFDTLTLVWYLMFDQIWLIFHYAAL